MLNEACFERLLETVCSVFDAYSAILFLPGGDGSFVLKASFSLGDSINKGVALTEGQGLVGWIIRNRQPLVIDNFDQKKGVLGYYDPKAGQESSIKAFMGCPLGGEAGVIGVDSKRTHAFGSKDQKLLHQFARLAKAVHDSLGGQDKAMCELSACRSIQILCGLHKQFPKWVLFLKQFLDLVAQASGFSHVFLAARDELGENYFIEGWNRCPILTEDYHKRGAIPIGSGTVGWVFNNRVQVVDCDRDPKAGVAPLFGRNLETPPFRSLVCLPLVVGRRTRGVLTLADEEGKELSGEIRLYLQFAADHLALLLENLYLRNRLAVLGAKRDAD